jgi:hypothetical protein
MTVMLTQDMPAETLINVPVTRVLVALRVLDLVRVLVIVSALVIVSVTVVVRVIVVKYSYFRLSKTEIITGILT